MVSEDGTQRHPLPLIPASVELNALNAAHGLADELTEQASEAKRKKVTQAREVRSVQRRLLAEFQDIETGDLLKFNHLEVRASNSYGSTLFSSLSTISLTFCAVPTETANLCQIANPPLGSDCAGADSRRRDGDRVRGSCRSQGCG